MADLYFADGMLKSSVPSVIRLRGVRHNNLKNFDLDLPLNQLIVITGLSGSGKSSLAFDTLFAEGQRRYIETFSPYARQFFDRMDKPQVDSIEGIPPAIAIEQRNSVRTTRSTVGTMTEICDFMKMLWPHISQLHCRQCGQPVRKDSPQSIWETIVTNRPPTEGNGAESPEFLITFELALSDKLSLEESLALVARQGYQRLLIGKAVVRIDDAVSTFSQDGAKRSGTKSIIVIQDRLRPTSANRARFIEACEQAYHFGKGKLAIHEFFSKEEGTSVTHRVSNLLHCARCDIEYRDPSPALFSFNNPVGACPSCRGFGRIISIDYNCALPDRKKTLAGGVVKPWQTGHGLESQKDMMRMCRHFEIPTDVPFEKLARKWQDFIIEGDPNYGKDEEHEWPRAWYGVKGYFRWLESKAYKMHVRVLLSRYRAYTQCPTCQGKRFQPDTLLYLVSVAIGTHKGREGKKQNPIATSALPEVEGGKNSGFANLTLADFYQLTIWDALEFIKSIGVPSSGRRHDPIELILSEVGSRLSYLNEVGLGYLTLDRPTRSLSGGETERVSLTTCLGTRLVNTLFVLDEPSVGLHPRDTERLVRILKQLRNAGNTVVVVEHEPSVMAAGDQLIDLGPGHGASGGEVVFKGNYRALLRARNSLTGKYLSGRAQIEIPNRRPFLKRQGSSQIFYENRERLLSDGNILNDAPGRLSNSPEADASLKLWHVTRHNLNDLSIELPLGRFVCITGVSGSGKTTLIREVLLPALQSKLNGTSSEVKASERFGTQETNEDAGEQSSTASRNSLLIQGWESLGRVVLVDQSVLGKTPRSNPAVYIGAFDDIREFYAQCEPARQRGLNASAFSFNSSQGQCERCRGAGFEKIEMQFLSDVFIRCPECNGRRYRRHILDIRVATPTSHERHAGPAKSIGDLLDATVEEAVIFLGAFPDSRPAKRAVDSLALLTEVGLGYLKLGQPINTLSGGESQRLKLVRYLAEASAANSGSGIRSDWTERQVSPHSRLRYRTSSANPSLSTLFLFDEPTTGLHFEDVRVLLKVFQRLVDSDNSVIVIEHNLEVIKSADWVIDLGPDAGEQGGRIVAEGTPEQIAACDTSYTGAALKQVLVRTQSPQLTCLDA